MEVDDAGIYTAKSVYSVLMTGGRIKWHLRKIWKFSVPLSVDVFTYLLLQGKLLTKDVMQKRNFNCPFNCVLCQDCQLETAMHLLFLCSYSKTIWDNLATYASTSLMVIDSTVVDVWLRSSQIF